MMDTIASGVVIDPAFRTTLCIIEEFWGVDTLSSPKEETRRPSYRPDIPPQPQPSRTQVFDHLGLVAGLLEDRGIPAVFDTATRQDPARRMVTAGPAVTALGRNGLGFVHPPRDLVPHFFPHTPSARLIAPALQARPLNADPLGRALETLYDYGVTVRSSRMAATAAMRLGLVPTCTPLDRPSFPGDGRSTREQEPEAEGRPSPRGSRRGQRPDLHHGMREVLVEHQAGMPLLRHPRRGQSSEAHECGPGLQAHRAQGPTTYGRTARVAERAFDSADNLQTFAETTRKGITRVLATLRAAPQGRAQAGPQHLAPRTEG